MLMCKKIFDKIKKTIDIKFLLRYNTIKEISLIRINTINYEKKYYSAYVGFRNCK